MSPFKPQPSGKYLCFLLPAPRPRPTLWLGDPNQTDCHSALLRGHWRLVTQWLEPAIYFSSCLVQSPGPDTPQQPSTHL